MRGEPVVRCHAREERGGWVRRTSDGCCVDDDSVAIIYSPGGRPAMEASASACGSTISPTVSPATISPAHRASTEVGANVMSVPEFFKLF